MLLTGLDDDFLLADDRPVGIGIVDALVNRHIDPAHRVDKANQAVEIDLGVMRDVHAEKFACLLDGKRGAAVGIRGIEFAVAVTVDVDHRVAGNRDERRGIGRRIHAHDDVRVGAGAHGLVVRTSVRADEHHVERLVEARRLDEHVVDLVELGRAFLPFGERIVHAVHPQGGRRTRPNEHHEHGENDRNRNFLPARAFSILLLVIRVRT